MASVGGAGALLGDSHAEAGQAAVRVAGAQMEVVGPALAAGEAFHLGLQDGPKGGGAEPGWVSCTAGSLRGQSSQPFLGVLGGPLLHPGLGPSSHRMLPDLPRGREQWGGDGPREDRGAGTGPKAGRQGRPGARLGRASGPVRAGAGTNLALALSSSVTLGADAALGVAAATDLLRRLAVAS